MTKEQAAAIWPVMKAFAEGREVQWRQGNVTEWITTPVPTFTPDLEWRIAPEKLEIRGWLNVYREGRTYFHPTKEAADRAMPTAEDRIACVEVRGEYEVPAES